MWLAPSLRDRAVCEALPLCLDRLQPQRRNWQAPIPDSRRLQPSLHILSMKLVKTYMTPNSTFVSADDCTTML